MAVTLDQWETRLRRAGSKVTRLALEVVEAAAVDGVNVAQGVVPVITGDLQDSISLDRVVATSKAVEASYSAKEFYAKFVEEGTVKMAPRRYMRISAMIVVPKLRRRSRELAVKVLKK